MTPSLGLTESAAILPLWQGPLLPLIALAWPLLLGLLMIFPPVRVHALRLLPLAPLPALLLALLPAPVTTTTVPGLLLGVELEVDAIARVLIGMTAALWLAAGVYAVCTMRSRQRAAIFSGFWCLTLAGNLGVFLAADAVTFYVAFAAVSLASYFLVVHEGTRQALRASRIYIVIAIAGEAMLLIAFVMIMAGADSTEVVDMRLALAGEAMEPGLRYLALGLLIAGFGIKAGLMPLHLWLPPAHSSAPTAASAVLSGAIVKAGLIGLIRFLPEGDAISGGLLIALGLTGTYLAVILGLTQHRIKAVLAYSTVSQMGLIIATVGAGLSTGRGDAVRAASYYGLHHGFAKGALFLSVGLLPLLQGRARTMLIAFMALVSASIAGAPGTGGALAKAAIKPAFDGWLPPLVIGSSIATTLILARYLFLAAHTGSAKDAGPVTAGRLAPVLLTGAAALVMPWFLWNGLNPQALGEVLQVDTLWSGVWPILIGASLAVAGGRLVRDHWQNYPRVPQGDLVMPLERLTEGAIAFVRQRQRIGPARPPAWHATRLQSLMSSIEARLTRWPVAGTIVLVSVLLIGFLALGLHRG